MTITTDTAPDLREATDTYAWTTHTPAGTGGDHIRKLLQTPRKRKAPSTSRSSNRSWHVCTVHCCPEPAFYDYTGRTPPIEMIWEDNRWWSPNEYELYRSPVATAQVPSRPERSNAAPIYVVRAPTTVSVLIERCGYRPGLALSEQADDYCRVLAVKISDNERLIVCRNELQVIHQRRRGKQWQNLSFHMTMNTQLKELLGNSEAALPRAVELCA